MENWYWCYLFSIWSGNVTLFEDDGQVVYVCLCACMSVSETCEDRATENERGQFSLCFFFSLSPSLLPEGQGFESECIVKKKKWNWLFFSRRRATCQLLRNQTFKKKPSDLQFFLDTRFKSRLNRHRFWNPFDLWCIYAPLPKFPSFSERLSCCSVDYFVCLLCRWYIKNLGCNSQILSKLSTKVHCQAWKQ